MECMEGLSGVKQSKLEILYEDNHILVVVKPNNILSQADSTKDLDLLTMLKQYIKEKYHKPGNVYLGLVHRLDRPVSGIMVFARSSKAASRLSEQIRVREFKKTYLAVVQGIPKKEDTFCDYLLKQENGNTIVTNEKYGKYSELSYKVLESNKGKKLSLVEVFLKTGRHHQIRVQFSTRGHTLYGDSRYGMYDGKQIALHAYRLEFIHPVKKEKMIFINMPDVKNEPWGLFNCVKS